MGKMFVGVLAVFISITLANPACSWTDGFGVEHIASPEKIRAEREKLIQAIEKQNEAIIKSNDADSRQSHDEKIGKLVAKLRLLETDPDVYFKKKKPARSKKGVSGSISNMKPNESPAGSIGTPSKQPEGSSQPGAGK